MPRGTEKAALAATEAGEDAPAALVPLYVLLPADLKKAIDEERAAFNVSLRRYVEGLLVGAGARGRTDAFRKNLGKVRVTRG